MHPDIIDGLKTWFEQTLGISPKQYMGIDFKKYKDPYRLILDETKNLYGRKNIHQYWEYIRDYSPEIFLLMGWGFTYGESKRTLTSLHGEERLPTIDELLENPYILVGIGKLPYKKIDYIGTNTLNIPPEHPYRILGYLKHVLSKATTSGHLFLSTDSLLNDVKYILDVALEKEALLEMIASDKSESLVEDHTSGDSVVYMGWSYQVESESAKMVKDFIYRHDSSVDIDKFIERFERNEKIEFSDKQRLAIKLAAKNNIFILTGLPGTGKTTLTKCLCSLFKEITGAVPLLLTPTGVAARNLSDVTKIDAFTIHKALQYRGGVWEYNQHCQYDIDAVIVDEFSMVDQVVFYHLISALDSNTRLVLIGDIAQLPSVGPGNVLRELIISRKIPTISLTDIFRQEEASDIIVNAHRINKGEGLILKRKPPDFLFSRETDTLKIKDTIVKISQKLFRDEKEFQVLSPMYRGDVGVDSLNDSLRSSINPESREKKEAMISGFRFREGDRVIITKNQYKLEVYNGDIGKIKKIDLKNREITLKIFKPFRYLTMGLNDTVLHAMGLKLAYAITVHKVQGLEFDYIILPLVMGFYPLLQRNLLYTGVTRARKKLVLLGDPKAISKAIQNNKTVKRNTLLSKRIIDSYL